MTNLWTVGNQYYATGEGARWMYLVVTAESEEAAKAAFVRVFGAYFATGCTAHPFNPLGVVEESFLPPKMIKHIVDRLIGRAYIEYSATHYFNAA